jgi:Skp family chaperone for outer membrane proteins
MEMEKIKQERQDSNQSMDAKLEALKKKFK